MKTQEETRLDCEAVVRALWLYLDGRCQPERQALIEEHLELCASCRSHAEFERRLLGSLAEMGRCEGDTDALRARVVCALREAGLDEDVE